MLAAIALGAIVANKSMRRTVFAVVIAGILTAAVIPQIRDRITLTSASDPSNADRENLWKIALAIARDHPFAGIGADNWDLYFPRYKPAVTSAVIGHTDHPHNEYFNILTSFGVFGLAAYLWMWTAFIVAAVKRYRGETDPFMRGVLLGGGAAIFSVLIAQCTQDIFHDFTDQLTWWFIAGMVLAVIQHSSEQLHASISTPA